MIGQLEILIDTYTDFAKGTTGLRALRTIEIVVRPNRLRRCKTQLNKAFN